MQIKSFSILQEIIKSAKIADIYIFVFLKREAKHQQSKTRTIMSIMTLYLSITQLNGWVVREFNGWVVRAFAFSSGGRRFVSTHNITNM